MPGEAADKRGRPSRGGGPSRRQVRVVISGRVQGVWFRGWTLETAHRFRLDGWVRNCRDGTVEAVFAGAPDKVQAMLEACQSGPPMARVTDVAYFDHEEAVEPGFLPLPSR